MEIKNNLISNIPIHIPKKKIYSRLGFNKYKTVLKNYDKNKIDIIINEAFSVCETKGIWSCIPIIEIQNKKIILENQLTFDTESLFNLLNKCSHVVLMAATVGKKIIDEIENFIKNENGVNAIIYDAVGGESADYALSWINEYIRQIFFREKMTLIKSRFSPGYGDVGLIYQKKIFEKLNLKMIGLSLSNKYMLIPEKSVIGITGVIRSNFI